MPDAYPADTIAAMALWLARRTGRLRQHEAAAEAVSEITAAVRQAQRAIDRPPDMVFLGSCDSCQDAVYAVLGAATARCTCGASYDVAERRGHLLCLAEDILGTAAEISRALTRLGQPLTPSAIRGLVFRGRLAAHGTDASRRSLFRVGDVMDAVTRENEKSPRAGKRPGDTASHTP